MEADWDCSHSCDSLSLDPTKSQFYYPVSKYGIYGTLYYSNGYQWHKYYGSISDTLYKTAKTVSRRNKRYNLVIILRTSPSIPVPSSHRRVGSSCIHGLPRATGDLRDSGRSITTRWTEAPWKL